MTMPSTAELVQSSINWILANSTYDINGFRAEALNKGNDGNGGWTDEMIDDVVNGVKVGRAKAKALELLKNGDARGAKNTLMLTGMMPEDIRQFIAENAPKTETTATEVPVAEVRESATSVTVKAEPAPQGDANLDERYREYGDYLRAIFRPGDTLCFIRINHAKNKTEQVFAPFEDALTRDSFENVLRDNADASIYVAMNTFPPDLVGQRKGRTQANVVSVRALQADMDDVQQAANIVNAMQASAKVPPPSIVVESSTGKRQGIWLVDGIAKENAKPLMQAIAAEFGTDSAVAEVARVMRVPGFVNRKYDTSPIAKLLVNTGVRYTRDAFKFDAKNPTAQVDGGKKESFDLKQPFIHHKLDHQICQFIGHYMAADNIKNPDTLFDLIEKRVQENGCFEPKIVDGKQDLNTPDLDAPYSINWTRVRELCDLKTNDTSGWKTGEEKQQEARVTAIEEATAEANKIAEQAAAAFAAIPKDQIVTTPQQFPVVQADAAAVTLLAGEPRPFNPWQYALKPLYGLEFSGWFPLGRVTLASGSSGAMKTTFLAQALIAGRDGEEFLGHEPGMLPFKFLFADRGKYDCEETFKRMNLVGKVPYECLNGIPRHTAAQKISEVAATGDYKILVIDGGDLLVNDNNDGSSVGDFTLAVQRIAEHYGVGIIVTTGAGKMSPQALKQGAERRTITKGSEVWGRTGGSVFTLNSEHDGTQDTRRLVVQHRNAPTEKFLLQLKNGRLVVVNEAQLIEDSQSKTILDWVLGHDTFTAKEAKRHFKWSGTTTAERLGAMVKMGVIKQHEQKGGRGRKPKVWYEVPSTINALKKAAADYEKSKAENTVDLDEHEAKT